MNGIHINNQTASRAEPHLRRALPLKEREIQRSQECAAGQAFPYITCLHNPKIMKRLSQISSLSRPHLFDGDQIGPKQSTSLRLSAFGGYRRVVSPG
jgi:hypothetical protein